MATQHSVAVRDNSTLTNFKQWAQIISNFMATITWTQTGDTGQVNWGTIASVPGTNSFVYEMWKPSDALTSFILKIEYGTQAIAGRPALRLSIGTGSDGAGNLTGFIGGPFTIPTAVPVSSTVTQWDCYLSGDAGRVAIAMWVNDTTNTGPIFFGVARSKNSSGTNTSSHASLAVCGIDGSAAPGMQTIVFGVGAAPLIANTSSSAALPCIDTGLAANLFNSQVPFSPVFPAVGFFDNPLIEFGAAATNDITDQATFTIPAADMPYGVSHTFIGFRAAPFTRWPSAPITNGALVMLYE